MVGEVALARNDLITAVALRITQAWTSRRYLDSSLFEPKEVASAL